jgi:RNA-directed DNA polymerase
VTAPRTLAAAWKRVAAHKGTAGVEGSSSARFKAQASHSLAELERALRAGTYQPLPARRVHIPQGRGTPRPLGLAAGKDRLGQAAVQLGLAPIFARHLLPCTYGCRPGRGGKDALREVDRWLKPTFKGVWSLGANFAPLPLPDTRHGQYLRRHTR